MKREDFWVIFSKSGKVEDYLTYKAIENKKESKGKKDAVQHKRTDN